MSEAAAAGFVELGLRTSEAAALGFMARGWAPASWPKVSKAARASQGHPSLFMPSLSPPAAPHSITSSARARSGISTPMDLAARTLTMRRAPGSALIEDRDQPGCRPMGCAWCSTRPNPRLNGEGSPPDSARVERRDPSGESEKWLWWRYNRNAPLASWVNVAFLRKWKRRYAASCGEPGMPRPSPDNRSFVTR
jgi:hypothetical protein